ncbi:MAG TPA: hypothetical protein VH062_27790 [Polyangiaceae bacterium]|jgi:hypothetical protein|nr:hypothetical protein [Polyangiaceae bacterium]
MSERTRLVGGLTLSISTVAAGLAGCGADPGGTSPASNGWFAGTTPSIGGSAVAAATGAAPGVTTPVGAGGSIAPATGAGGATATVPAGAGGSPVSTPPSSGGTTGVVDPGTGGAATTPSGATGGAAGAPPSGPSTIGGPGDDWTVSSHLDANGLLIAPATGEGYQIQTTSFELDPGQEVFKCFHTAVPNDAELDVGHWESQMSAGSHHFILYTADQDTSPAGTLSSSGCVAGFGGSTWLYTAGSPHWHLPYPDGVAVPLVAHQKIQFDMHYINTGTDVINAHVTLNIEKVKSAQFQKAQAQISFNTQIAIPPNGMQTVGGDCTPPPGVNFFLMGTHTHRRGIDASITRKLASGQMGEELVHTTNWDSPQAVLWENAPYLTFAAGEKFHYSCSYQNDRASVTTVGDSAANNEMCMAITYFFPAKAGGTCN